MKTIVPLEPFEGYPSGKRRSFVKGEEADVPNDFADLVVSKGHAREKPERDKPADPAPNASKEKNP